MKIAIYGPSGAGKSTVARTMSLAGLPTIGINKFEHIECDKLIHDSFRESKNVQEWILDNCYDSLEYSKESHSMTVNRDILGDFLFNPKHSFTRSLFEDLLFKEVITPIINNHIELNNNIIVDGLLPRFIDKFQFDMSIFITADKNIRYNNLLKRGVSEKRIFQIFEIQKNIFFA